MNLTQHYDNLCAAAKHFGLDAQIEKTMEEIGEVYNELACRKNADAPQPNIVSEIADVYNMLDQLCILMDCEDQVQEIAEFKMERTMQRYDISGR